MAAEVKKFTRKEVADSDPEKTPRFIIRDHVYDVAKFLDEHPGGHEVLLKVAGTDATEDFDDIGHSLDAKELMKQYRVGELVDEEKSADKSQNRQVSWQGVAGASTSEEAGVGFLSSWKFPVVLGIVVTLLYTYLFG